MSARERLPALTVAVTVTLTAAALLLDRARDEIATAAVLASAASVWWLTATLSAALDRHAAAVRSLRHLELRAHSMTRDNIQAAQPSHVRVHPTGRAPGTGLRPAPDPSRLKRRPR